jgi:hypothetical protein
VVLIMAVPQSAYAERIDERQRVEHAPTEIVRAEPERLVSPAQSRCDAIEVGAKGRALAPAPCASTP